MKIKKKEEESQKPATREELEARIKNLKAKVEETEKSFENSESEEEVGAVNKSTNNSTNYKHVPHGNRSDSLESKTLQAFGCSHITDLLKVNTAAKRFSHVPRELGMAARTIKENFDIARFIGQICVEKKADDSNDDQITPCERIMESRFAKEVIGPISKAFNSTVSGDGAEWVPTAVSANHIPEFELDRRIASLFREIPMPSNPFKIPVLTDQTIARRIGQGVAITEAQFKTSDLTFTAEKFGEYYPLPEELDQDSAPPILAIAREQVLESQRRAMETLILNADDSVAHMDAGVAADAAITYSKGLRKKALDNSANGSVIDFNGVVLETPLNKLRRAMGKFGVTATELSYIFGPAGYFQATDLEKVLTVDNFGPMATILNGQLENYKGSPIVISEYMNELTAGVTGVTSGVALDDIKATCLLVNVTRFMVGMRQPVRVKVQNDLAYHDRYLLASYSRFDFQGLPQSDKEVSVALGVNIDIAS